MLLWIQLWPREAEENTLNFIKWLSLDALNKTMEQEHKPLSEIWLDWESWWGGLSRGNSKNYREGSVRRVGWKEGEKEVTCRDSTPVQIPPWPVTNSVTLGRLIDNSGSWFLHLENGGAIGNCQFLQRCLCILNVSDYKIIRCSEWCHRCICLLHELDNWLFSSNIKTR